MLSNRRLIRTIPLGAAAYSVLLGLAGCSQSTVATAPAVEPAASQAMVAQPQNWPRVDWPLPHDAALEARVDALLATMSVEEKVGQIVQGDIDSITPEDLRKYRLGSILAGGNSDPGRKYNAAP